ncbi:MAG: hypothetical protein IJR88_06455 [Clostridia bacterium]|nr:hypothetical protein [Clostridia bacterium]
MSKKKRIALVVSGLLILCILVGGTIGGIYYFKNLHYSHDAKIVKQLLVGLNTNITQTGKKGFAVSFREQYDVEAQEDPNIDEVSFSISYVGEGNVSMSYELSCNEEADAIDLGHLMEHGAGYLSGTQKESYVYYDKSTSLVDGEEIANIQDVAYSLDHSFTVKIDGEDCYVAGESLYRDQKSEENDLADQFYGKIDKAVLLDTFSREELAEATQRLFFMDSWTYVKQIADLSNRYFKTLDLKNPQEVNAFMKKHRITVQENGNVVKVGFVLDTTEIFAKESDMDLGELPAITGSMEIERESGDVLHFEYDLGQLLLSLLMKMNTGRPYFKATVGEFILEGRVLNSTMEDKLPDGEFTEYDEASKAEFIYEFSKHIIPFGQDLG